MEVDEDSLPTFSFYLDDDGDGFGDVNFTARKPPIRRICL